MRLWCYIACLLISWSDEAASDKLSPQQKAPLHARSSAGRALALPSKPTGAVGLTPANVGQLRPGPAAPPPSSSVPRQSDIQREETDSFKEVNGETVRAVAGSYAYRSPDGLPVSFKYKADEKGNQASFTIGAGGGSEGSGSKFRPSGGSPKPGVGVGGGAKLGGAGGIGTAGDAGRQYLPPN